jgi:O-antigen/teichoic acid export membrane protein
MLSESGTQSPAPKPRSKPRESTFQSAAALSISVRGADLIVSAFLSLALPLLASKSDYGAYRLVVLYAGYAGLVHLGLLDGFYLYALGRRIGDIPHHTSVAVLRTLVLLYLFFGSALLLLLYSFLPTARSGQVAVTIGIGWILIGLATYYNFLYQATRNFRAFAIANLAGRASAALAIACLFAWSQVGFTLLAASFVVPLIVTLFAYLALAGFRPIPGSPVGTAGPLGEIWLPGLTLFAGNLAMTGLFSVDNVFVSVVSDPTRYADYAFAYSLAAVAFAFVEGAASAMTPYLACASDQTTADSRAVLLVQVIAVWLTPATFWLYEPLILRFYPSFEASIPLLRWFSVALPCATLIRARLVPQLKASRRPGLLLRFGCFALLAASLSIFVAYVIEPTLASVAAAWSMVILVAGLVATIVVLPSPLGRRRVGALLSAQAFCASALFLLVSHIAQRQWAVLLYSTVGLACALLLPSPVSALGACSPHD